MREQGPVREAGAGRWLELEVPRPWALAISFGLVLVISAGDLATGPYLVFATFYIAPVVIAAWFVGRTPAMVVAALAAVVGAVSTALDPGDITPPVYLWNAVFRFMTYGFIAVLVDAERNAVHTIRALSEVDPLTGLANRRSFYARARIEIERALRSREPIAVVCLDVDDLKIRNDTQGHQAGDEMLVELADIARREFRATDLMARLGGDEFCLLLPGADLERAEQVVDRFVSALAREPASPISVSAGIVAGTVDEPMGIEPIIHHADAAMYEAKLGGKGRVCVRAGLSEPTLTDEAGWGSGGEGR